MRSTSGVPPRPDEPQSSGDFSPDSLDGRFWMYETPRVERFGSLGKLTMFKPNVGADGASPFIPDDCTFPSEVGGNPTDQAECSADLRS
jgi:hypothetical protein